MPGTYTHLTTQERAVVMTMRDDLCSVRSIAKRLGRAPSSISRELRRAPGAGAYDANRAHLQSGARRIAPRRLPKLQVDGALFQVERWFATLTEKQIRRGTHRSTRQLEDAIRSYLKLNNAAPKPFVWTKSANDILATIERFCLRTSNLVH